MRIDKDELLQKVTRDYLTKMSKNNPPDYTTIKSEILEEVELCIEAENQLRSKETRWKTPVTLSVWQIAQIILSTQEIKSITLADMETDGSTDFLGVYMTEGENEGIYVDAEKMIGKITEKCNSALMSKHHKEVIEVVKRNAIRTTRCEEKNLIAVANGIFDYKAKQLLPFSPEKVFISKCAVNYNPNAKNDVIHNDDDGTDWDVESWILDLFDGDKEMELLIWQLFGANIRSNIPWDKACFFYSESGSNSKGTLVELMRQLCGKGSYTSIPLGDFGKDFMLEPLVRGCTNILVDENDVGLYIDKAANIKALITGDIVQVNRKFKTPISLRFRGFMVQCLNSMPRIKDKSDSFL